MDHKQLSELQNMLRGEATTLTAMARSLNMRGHNEVALYYDKRASTLITVAAELERLKEMHIALVQYDAKLADHLLSRKFS